MSSVWQVATSEDGLVVEDDQSGEEDEDFGDIMVNFEQVRIIRLEQEEQQMEEEQELEEEMLQSELETEYVLEDGKLRKIDKLGNSEITHSGFKTSPEEEIVNFENKFEKLESLVMLAEDGSARIVVGGKENTEDVVLEEHFILGSNDVHYVLGNEEVGQLGCLGEEEENDIVKDESSNFEVKLTETTDTDGYVDRTITNEKKCDLDNENEPGIKKQENEEGQTKGRDQFVLEQKDVDQEIKEKTRRNLVLGRRDGSQEQVEVVVDSGVGHQEVAIGDGEVIHQSELLDGSLVTGYLVLGEGDQVVHDG